MLFASGIALTQIAAGSDRVSDFVNDYLKKKQIPGCAVMVRHNGKVVLSAGYGMANLEHGVGVTPQTVFQSGSMGKQFTAMAVMMLVEEHNLSLDDPISKYLAVPPSWSSITVRHLLTHTSGLGDYPDDFSLQKDYTEDDLLKMITAQPLGSATSAAGSASTSSGHRTWTRSPAAVVSPGMPVCVMANVPWPGTDSDIGEMGAPLGADPVTVTAPVRSVRSDRPV